MNHARHRDGVREQPRRLPHTPIIIDGLETSSVQEGIPIGHVDEGLLDLRPCILKLGEEPSGSKVVVVLIDLPQGIADFQVRLIVVHPMLPAAVYRDPAVGALKVNPRRGEAAAMMGVMRTARMLPDEGGPATYLGTR